MQGAKHTAASGGKSSNVRARLFIWVKVAGIAAETKTMSDD
jgi:hypothetical protein